MVPVMPVCTGRNSALLVAHDEHTLDFFFVLAVRIGCLGGWRSGLD